MTIQTKGNRNNGVEKSFEAKGKTKTQATNNSLASAVTGLHHRTKSPPNHNNIHNHDTSNSISNPISTSVPIHYKKENTVGKKWSYFHNEKQKRRYFNMSTGNTNASGNSNGNTTNNIKMNPTCPSCCCNFHLCNCNINFNRPTGNSSPTATATSTASSYGNQFIFQILKICILLSFISLFITQWYIGGIVMDQDTANNEIIENDAFFWNRRHHHHYEYENTSTNNNENMNHQSTNGDGTMSGTSTTTAHIMNNDYNYYYHDTATDAPLSQAAKRFHEWKTMHQFSFLKEGKDTYISRQQQRKDRIDYNLKKIYNYQQQQGQQQKQRHHTLNFLNESNIQNSNAKINSVNSDHHQQQTQQQQQQQQPKSNSPCGIAAQLSSNQYPQSYPNIHSINENSIIIITGILSQIGFHLATQLSTQCNVQSIIGIDPILPNTKSHRIYKLDQLHNLYQTIPTLQQRLIVPYVGFNPKEPYNKQFEYMINEETGEIDFSLLSPTHVIHIMSIDDYRSSSLDGSDSIYILNEGGDGSDDDEESNNNRRRYVGNHIFGLRQNLIGLDHLMSTLTHNRKNNDDKSSSPIHFTLVSDIQVISSSPPGTNDGKMNDHSNDFRTTAKLMEEVMFDFYKDQGMDSDTFITVRLPFVYGPWSSPGSVDHDLVEAAMRYQNDNQTKHNSEKDTSDIILSMIGENNSDARLKDILFVDGK